MKACRSLGAAACIALFSFADGRAQAPATAQPATRFLVGGALELGGDRVAEVYFTNGNSQSVNAGQGISLAVGAEYQVPKVERLLFRATVGYKYVTTAADNVHVRLTRVPIQLTANWMLAANLRVGAGLALHRGIRLRADGLGEDIRFGGASGPTFDIAYRGVGLMYTAMKYTDQYHATYSANAVGIAFTAVIPRRSR